VGFAAATRDGEAPLKPRIQRKSARPFRIISLPKRTAHLWHRLLRRRRFLYMTRNEVPFARQRSVGVYRGVRTRACRVETRLDAVSRIVQQLGISLTFKTGIETNLDAAARRAC
jgi:hypothetical protein